MGILAQISFGLRNLQLPARKQGSTPDGFGGRPPKAFCSPHGAIRDRALLARKRASRRDFAADQRKIAGANGPRTLGMGEVRVSDAGGRRIEKITNQKSIGLSGPWMVNPLPVVFPPHFLE